MLQNVGDACHKRWLRVFKIGGAHVEVYNSTARSQKLMENLANENSKPLFVILSTWMKLGLLCNFLDLNKSACLLLGHPVFAPTQK